MTKRYKDSEIEREKKEIINCDRIVIVEVIDQIGELIVVFEVKFNRSTLRGNQIEFMRLPIYFKIEPSALIEIQIKD